MRLRSLALLAALGGAALPASARLTLAQPAKLGTEAEAANAAQQREAIVHAKEQVKAAREKVDAAERELRYQRHRKRPRGEADARIEAAKGELAAAESELARAIEEGRRAGLQPGDFRDLGVE